MCCDKSQVTGADRMLQQEREICEKIEANDPEFKLRLYEDRVAVKVFEPETETTSGIIMPDVAQKVQYCGEVVAVGAGQLMSRTPVWTYNTAARHTR